MEPTPFSQWQHFKGDIYTVLLVAQHSETKENLVVYANAQGVTYARPVESFFENVQKGIPRFRKLK